MKKMAGSLREHEELLLNWFRAKGEMSSGAVEGFSSVVEQLLLPVVNLRGTETEFIAEVGDGNAVDDMPLNDRGLFLGSELPSSRRGYGETLHSCCKLTRTASYSISKGSKIVLRPVGACIATIIFPGDDN
jgi:hypothetical protein